MCVYFVVHNLLQMVSCFDANLRRASSLQHWNVSVAQCDLLLYTDHSQRDS